MGKLLSFNWQKRSWLNLFMGREIKSWQGHTGGCNLITDVCTYLCMYVCMYVNWCDSHFFPGKSCFIKDSFSWPRSQPRDTCIYSYNNLVVECSLRGRFFNWKKLFLFRKRTRLPTYLLCRKIFTALRLSLVN
jgi:hypothetical protein